jgi:hypothetical protein
VAHARLPGSCGNEVKHREFDVIPLLPVTEELVIQLTVLSTQTSRFDKVPVESRPDPTVFGESPAFLQQQGTDGIEQRIVRPIDGKCLGRRLRALTGHS